MTTGPARPARRRFTMDDLFSDTSPRAEGVSDLDEAKRIRLDRIIPDPDQPRRSIDAARLEELTASIRAEGVLVPIEVTYDAERNAYVIVHGERRWRASQAAGLTEIPALVREFDPSRRVVRQLMENLQREDLNAVDRARGLRAIKEAMGGVAWEQVADAVGIKRSRLFQLLDLEKLPGDIQDDIRAGRLTEKHARAFKDLEDEQQSELRDAVVTEGLSSDETLRAARELRSIPATTVRQAVERVRRREPARPARPAAPEAAPAADVAPPAAAPEADTEIAAPDHDPPAAAEAAAPQLLAPSELLSAPDGREVGTDSAAPSLTPEAAPAPEPGSYTSLVAALDALQAGLMALDANGFNLLERGTLRNRIMEILDLLHTANVRLGRAQAEFDAAELRRAVWQP